MAFTLGFHLIILVPFGMAFTVLMLVAEYRGIRRSVRAHAGLVGHPIVRSFQPGEDWRCCYVDEAFA